MPMDIGPNRRVAIEIPFAEAILYPRTMTGDQYERLVIRRDPVAHLSKGMPQVRFVELNEIFGVVLHVRSEGTQELKYSSTQECAGAARSSHFSPLTPPLTSHLSLLTSYFSLLTKDPVTSRSKPGP
jgi:hypothetical protein